MAVINTVDDALSHPQTAGEISGAPILRIVETISIAAGDDNGSIYFVGEVPNSAVLDSITIEGTDITGGTDFQLGLYNVDGSVIDANCLMDTTDFSSITGLPLGPHGVALRQCLTAVALADANKEVYLLAGHVNKAFPASGETNLKAKYRIGLLAATIGSEAVDLVVTTTYRKKA